MKNMKKITLVTLMISIIFVFVACSKDKGKSTENVDFDALAKSVTSQIDVNSMKEGDADKLKRFYGVDSVEYEDFVLYLPPSNVKADELLILKAKNNENMELLKGKVQKRVEEQSLSFKDYLPTEYAVVQKNVIEVKGNYILLSISKDSDKVQKAFKDGCK